MVNNKKSKVSEMKFDVAIPTYKRRKVLEECLNSIYKQDLSPERIFIVDDGDLPEDFISKHKKKAENEGINLIHYKKNHPEEPRGSNESKNKAFELAKEKIAFLFDDDVVLRENFFEEIRNLWEENKEDDSLIGVSGIAENYRKKRRLEKAYNRIFGLTSNYDWDVNDAAFQVWDTGIEEVKKGYYMSGFCCSFRVEKAREIKFTVFKGGRAGGADPDFALKAKKEGYHFLINPKAKVIHNQTELSREKAFRTGFKESSNRKITFKNNCEKTLKNRLWFIWANIGWILRQFLTGNFRKGLGMIYGLFHKDNKNKK